MAHTLEVVLADQRRHTRRQFYSWFRSKERVITFFVTTSVVSIVGIIMVNK